MGLRVNGTGEDFEMVPEGVFTARCFKIIDLGTQTTTGMFGTKSLHKILIVWELLDDRAKMADGRPFSITQFYTASLHEKAKLRKDLEAWRGKRFTDSELEEFDLMKVMGAYCMIQVVHSADGKFANVNSIMAFEGIKPKPVNPNVSFDIDNPDMEIFESFSENMKAKITSAPEWKQGQAMSTTDDDVVVEDLTGEEEINLDDIPF